MTRNGLRLLQAVGALSILPYPFVLLANIMSIAAPGHNSSNSVPWILLSFYPLSWIALFVLAWRAMARGGVGLAFGLSSVPALASLVVVAVYLLSWLGFALGMAGIGKGGLHSTDYPNNPLLDSISLAIEDVELPPGRAAFIEKARSDIDANPTLVNLSIYPRGSPLNVALGSLSVSLDGTINGDHERQQDRIQIVRALLAHGAHLTVEEATDLRKTWTLRRVIYDGPVATASENPLVWRIVTHNRGESKPFDPLKDPFPSRRDGPEPFVLKDSEIALLNRTTRVHGTPLYAALLDNATDVCRVIIKAGGRLSGEEERDPSASSALHSVLQSDAGLRAAYSNVHRRSARPPALGAASRFLTWLFERAPRAYFFLRVSLGARSNSENRASGRNSGAI